MLLISCYCYILFCIYKVLACYCYLVFAFFFIDRVLNVHYRSFNLGFKIWDSKFLIVSTLQVFPCLFVRNAFLLNSWSMWWIAQVLISILILSKNRYCYRRTTYWFDSSNLSSSLQVLAFFFSLWISSCIETLMFGCLHRLRDDWPWPNQERSHFYLFKNRGSNKKCFSPQVLVFLFVLQAKYDLDCHFEYLVQVFFQQSGLQLILIVILNVLYRIFFNNLDFSWYENQSVGLS